MSENTRHDPDPIGRAINTLNEWIGPPATVCLIQFVTLICSRIFDDTEGLIFFCISAVISLVLLVLFAALHRAGVSITP